MSSEYVYFLIKISFENFVVSWQHRNCGHDNKTACTLYNCHLYSVCDTINSQIGRICYLLLRKDYLMNFDNEHFIMILNYDTKGIHVYWGLWRFAFIPFVAEKSPDFYNFTIPKMFLNHFPLSRRKSGIKSDNQMLFNWCSQYDGFSLTKADSWLVTTNFLNWISCASFLAGKKAKIHRNVKFNFDFMFPLVPPHPVTYHSKAWENEPHRKEWKNFRMIFTRTDFRF